jgi:Putative DNA-binding domain
LLAVASVGEQVSLERLRQLLDQGESLDLDFKRTCDLNERSELVAITKDIAAFAAMGGHLVVGVNEDGTPSGLFDEVKASLFDEARLRSKIAPKYLPETISVTTAVHEIDGKPVVVIYIAPHPSGFVVVQRDGDYSDAGRKQAKEFRAGEVYVRRGSSSRTWNQDEADAALDRVMAVRKEQWRIELRDDLAGLGLGRQAQRIARGPVASFTWQLDEDAFSATLVELVRARDDIPITLAFDAMDRDAAVALANGKVDDLRTIMDRLASAAAIGITISRSAPLERAVRSLIGLYNLGYDSFGVPRYDLQAIRVADLWLELITRIYAVGALAVRKQDWSAVRVLTLQKGRGSDFDYYTNWLRHAVTEAARAGSFQAVEGERRVELSLLVMASEHVQRMSALRPDTTADDPEVLTSLTQFDLVSIFVAIEDAGDLNTRSWYANFARFDWSRSEPALVKVLEDPSVRTALLPRLSDEELATAIREVSRMAQGEGFRFAVWAGWRSPTVQQFLEGHPSAAA